MWLLANTLIQPLSEQRRVLVLSEMDAAQLGLPILGIVAAAAVTFYAVSFSELREKSFRDLDESETETGGGFKSSASSREKRARRKAEKEARK